MIGPELQKEHLFFVVDPRFDYFALEADTGRMRTERLGIETVAIATVALVAAAAAKASVTLAWRNGIAIVEVEENS